MRQINTEAEVWAVVSRWVQFNPKYKLVTPAQIDAATQSLIAHIGGVPCDIEAPRDGKLTHVVDFDLDAALGL